MGISTKVSKLIKFISMTEQKYSTYSREEIMDALNISESTFYRYLKQLREEVEIPIEKDQRTDGYKIREDYYMTPPDLSVSEALSLVLAGNNILNNLEFPYCNEVNMATAKLMATLPEETNYLLSNLENKIHFNLKSLVDYNNYSEVFNTLQQGIQETKKVRIEYDSASKNEVTKRKISPYALDFNEGALYVYAHCNLRQDMRVFRVDRIKGIELLDLSFIYPDDFSVEDYLGTAWGVECGKEEEEIKIKFTGRAVRKVKENNYHSTQELEEINEDEVVMTINTCSFNEVKEWILGFGAEAEVLKPERLREEVREEVDKLREVYGND
ncbi:helix-turn-helix transcriptional regulator [Halanaerobacter jeridensis]|uniref:DNA-binding transcriptional regulator YafY n=1 Tax=Halanaerobacter jeridensis TaxID=706427 RepID=A0A939BP05_9FIRM|nr:WYL domain-containing transcriptional regulator [Halanaerobacter jeridensis]MBM7556088.1 putative DNA-binding transcriptional regulator YafY [Halanaerobacter jeridensis]